MLQPDLDYLAYFTSNDARYINGSTVAVDGGSSIF